MTKIVDYTSYRRNSMIHNRYICVCPNCGKKGLRFVFSKPGLSISEYVHEGIKTLDGVEFTKSCKVESVVTANFPEVTK